MTGSRYAPGMFHSMAGERRLRIVMSSSTLHNFWSEGYEGDVIHVDWNTAPGANIQTLHNMWYAEYKNQRKPVDIVLVGGLNNILQGDSNNKIMGDIEAFYSSVVGQ